MIKKNLLLFYTFATIGLLYHSNIFSIRTTQLHLQKKAFHHQKPRIKKNIADPQESLNKAVKTEIAIEKDSKTEEEFETKERDWNLIIYMAANNNLHKYALKNIRQLLTAGSSNSINVLLQLDELMIWLMCRVSRWLSCW